MTKLWKNTSTLDKFVPELLETVGAAEAEIAVIGGKQIDLASMPKLKAIFKCGVGTDNVPFKEADSRGIEVWMPSEKRSDISSKKPQILRSILFSECCLMKLAKLKGGRSNRVDFLEIKKYSC